jgi:hypothetical protein
MKRTVPYRTAMKRTLPHHMQYRMQYRHETYRTACSTVRYRTLYIVYKKAGQPPFPL